MAANIERMALIGQPAWHGLEEVMNEDSTMEEWAVAAALDHAIEKVPVLYKVNADGFLRSSEDKFVLFRTDTGRDLSIVSEQYNVVQPKEILDSFQYLIDKHGFKMETAGSLAGGKKIWAMASTGNTLQVGVMGDIIKQFILLATSYDGSIATTGKHTSQRVVCENTLNICLGNGEPAVKVNHRSVFDKDQMLIDLGLMESEWADFGVMANRMHNAPVSKASTAARWYAELLTERPMTDEEVIEMAGENRVLKQLMTVFREAKGGEPTVWGLVNGVTAFIDHVRGRSADTRLNSSWFGQGASLKQKAWDKAVLTVAANDSAVQVAA